jgi:predicted acetyltransferase
VFDVRPARDQEEFGRALYGIGQYFGGPATEEQLGRFTQILPVDRMHAAFEGDEIVGGAGAFPFQLSVPGAVLPCGGVTVVGVYPTHRRRGALRAMMTAQLHDIHEREEPIAALWASEETIYGRFGYGLAAWCCEVAIDRAWTRYAEPFEPQGRTRFVDSQEAAALFPPVWTELMRQRPGVFERTKEWWELRRLRMPDEEKANPKRFVALEIDGACVGYAVYRQFPNFEGGVSKARLEVQDAVGITPQATAELWRFLLDVDWYATLEMGLLPLDHPLFTLLANPRRMGARIGDSLWMRLVDLERALSSRAYAGDGALTVQVVDAVCPWNEGTWRIEDGAATRSSDAADLSLDVSALGAAYLGAVSFEQLRAGRRLEELVDGAVARADALFGWRPLPWCPEIF